jgi:hypothetical protein
MYGALLEFYRTYLRKPSRVKSTRSEPTTFGVEGGIVIT